MYVQREREYVRKIKRDRSNRDEEREKSRETGKIQHSYDTERRE